jgi:pimeloyl-ACP methyl ester carboxylesterase
VVQRKAPWSSPEIVKSPTIVAQDIMFFREQGPRPSTPNVDARLTAMSQDVCVAATGFLHRGRRRIGIAAGERFLKSVSTGQISQGETRISFDNRASPLWNWLIRGRVPQGHSTPVEKEDRDMGYRALSFLVLVACSFVAPATVSAQEQPPKKSSIDSDGVPIQYLVTGRDDGEAVVLIHGFLDNMESWERPKVISALKEEFKVIALDCRGHGKSGKPQEPEKYGQEMADDVARLLDHLKIKKAHMVGYSMGAAIALNFTVRYPDRVRTLSLGGGTAPAVNEEKLLEMAESLEKGKGLGPVLLALSPTNKPKPTAEQIKLMDQAVFSAHDPKVLAAIIRGATGKKGLGASDEQIKSVRVPTLALIGADDPCRVGTDRLKELLPNTRVVIIDKADHATAFISPELVSGLQKFLIEHREQPKK